MVVSMIDKPQTPGHWPHIDDVEEDSIQTGEKAQLT